MASSSSYRSDDSNEPAPSRNVSVPLFAATGAIAAAIFFALCWLAVYLPLDGPTHMYLQLFTPAEAGPVAALAQGLCWSLVFGAVAGGLIAIVFNVLTYLTRG